MRQRALRALRRAVVRARATLRGERALYFVLFIFVGVVGGLVGSLFRWLGFAFQTLYFSSYFTKTGTLLEIARELPWQMKILAPMGGALLCGLVVRYLLKGGGGEGVSELMEAVVLRQRHVEMRPAILKSLGSLFLMSSGGSVGREGPIITLGAAIATWFSGVLHLTPARRSMLIGCMVAACMAAVYNAPLGSALFVMEVIMANFAMDVFGPLVVASVAATLVSRALAEPGPLYEAGPLMPASVTEYFILGLLGIPCAFLGNLFVTLLDRGRSLLQAIRIPPVLKIALGGAAIGLIGVKLPEVWGNGAEAVLGTLHGSFVPRMLAFICIGKIVATAVSLGSGGLGGVMTPTLLVGASFGALMGSWMHVLAPAFTSDSGAYALVGMAGVLAATTHAPIMATFLTFEMSQSYAMILPLGVAAGVGALMARRFKKDSIYTERLARRGVDLDSAIEESALQAIHVSDVVWPDPPTVPPQMPARAVMEIFLKSRRHLMHVVGPDARYYGLIAIQDIVQAVEDRNLDSIIVAADLARQVPSVHPADPVQKIMERFWFQEYGELPVLKGTTPPQFVGVVTRRDILGAFDREVLRRRVLTARYRAGSPRAAASLPLMGEYAVQEVPLPSSLDGHTLAEMALPAKFQLTAIAVKRGSGDDGEELLPPPIDLKLQAGDRLVLTGRKADILRFTRQ